MPSIAPIHPEPQRAAVVPRARRLPDGDTLPIDQIVLQFVRHAEVGVIQLEGSHGSGKTTALRHLAAVLPREAPVLLFDDAPPASLGALARDHLIVAVAEARLPAVARLAMAPWNQDDLIEYLLSVHPQNCANVMRRIRSDDEAARLAGSPMLWRIVLDTFAADESLHFAASAVRRHVFALLAAHHCTQAAEIWCLRRIRGDALFFELPEPVMPLLMQPLVQVLLGAERLAELLSEGKLRDELKGLPRELIRETALLVRPCARAQAQLAQVARSGSGGVAGAASILAAVDPQWRPGVMQIDLAGAVLDRVRWTRIDLSNADLSRAGFSGADLAGANLYGAGARSAVFTGARLRRAEMRFLHAAGADFTGADLSSAALGDANLSGAQLRGANLACASCRAADLSGAMLSGACLAGANLSGALLRSVTLEDANLTGADLTAARLEHVRLSDAKLNGACFRDACVSRCDLENLHAERVDFRGADLSRSLLTGSVLLNADLRKARLARAGLAGIDWPGADLRGADLRGATFHLGSTRSGLVGSAAPCEGSRSGFYEEQLNERQFRPPEEIRRASLRGADLRGARIKGVDFYLVDLRGARYTRRQARHFRKCGAIL